MTRRPRIGWDADGRLHLGPPILQFTVDELLDDQRYKLFGSVLDYWVLNDLRNILRQQIGMRSASGPADYATNEVPPPSGFDLLHERRISGDLRARWEDRRRAP